MIGGDIHSFWVTDLKADFADPGSATVASEFVGTSVTSQGPPYDQFRAFLPENPHIRYFESRERGYVRVEATPGAWRTDLRAVSTVAQPEAQARTLSAGWSRAAGQGHSRPEKAPPKRLCEKPYAGVTT